MTSSSKQHVWSINGEIFSGKRDRSAEIDTTVLSGRGLAYGDGLFETMRAIGDDIPLLSLHMDRLEQGCKRLAINFNRDDCLQQIGQVLQPTLSKQPNLVKLILVRDGAAQGYASFTDQQALIYIRLTPLHLGHHPLNLKAQLCQTRLAIQPALAGLKHLNRLEQIIAASELEAGINEGILLNMNDEVVEAISSNIVAIIDDQLWFPDLSKSGVKGVMQTWLQRRAIEQGMSIENRIFGLDQLLHASEILLTNSVRGVRNLSDLSIEGILSWQTKSHSVGERLAALLKTELHSDFSSF